MLAFLCDFKAEFLQLLTKSARHCLIVLQETFDFVPAPAAELLKIVGIQNILEYIGPAGLVVRIFQRICQNIK